MNIGDNVHYDGGPVLYRIAALTRNGEHAYVISDDDWSGLWIDTEGRSKALKVSMAKLVPADG